MMMLCVVSNNGMYAKEDETKCSITIHYELEDVQFRLYQIGEIDKEGKPTLIAPYDESKATFKSEQYEKATLTLETYIREHQNVPDAYVNTDQDGTVSFTQLNKGIYLILSDEVKEGKYTYTPSAVMVTLPNRNFETNQTIYHIEMDMKYEKIHEDELPKYKNLEVKKVWDDQNNTNRPSSIDVVLLKNGKEKEVKQLNAKNGWQCTWENLSTKDSWDVKEQEVPNNYSVTKKKEQNTYILINTYETSGGSSTDKPIKVPDSGQLWWPVPILVLTGLVFIIFGVYRRQKEEGNEA